MHSSIRALAGAAALSLAHAGTAGAQEPPSPCASAEAPVAGDTTQEPQLLLAAGTPVEFEFAAPLSSKTSKIDEFFPIRVTKPILVGDQIAIAAGAAGFGQIVHAAKAGGAGKAGELIVAVRCIDVNGVRLPLRRYREGGIGDDNKEGALGVSMVVPFAGFLVKGGEKTIAAGYRGNAIVAADTQVTPANAAPAADTQGAPAQLAPVTN